MGLPRMLYDNSYIEAATLSAADTDTDYPIDNISDKREYIYWAGDGSTNSYEIEIDLGSAQSIDSIGLAGHNFNTVGARWKLRASSDDISYADIVSYETPSNDNNLVRFFNSASYRYWKIVIDNNGGSNFAPQLGVCFLCSYLEFEQPLSLPWDPDRVSDTVGQPASDTGYFLGSILEGSIRRLECRFEWVSISWVTNNWIPFLNNYRRDPFFFVWDYENHADEAYYCMLEGDSLGTPYMGGGYRELSFSLRARYE